MLIVDAATDAPARVALQVDYVAEHRGHAREQAVDHDNPGPGVLRALVPVEVIVPSSAPVIDN